MNDLEIKQDFLGPIALCDPEHHKKNPTKLGVLKIMKEFLLA